MEDMKYSFTVIIDGSRKTIEHDDFSTVVNKIYDYVLNTREYISFISEKDMRILLRNYELNEDLIARHRDGYCLFFYKNSDNTCYKALELLEFIFPIFHNRKFLKIIDNHKYKKICIIS